MDEAYEKLLNDYLPELREARDEALKWWSDLEEKARRIDPKTVEAQVRSRWPAGPVSYPGVVAVYRKYFLACEAINEEREATEAAAGPEAPPPESWGEDDEEEDPAASIIPPPALLLTALSEIAPDLDRFMESFALAPIGTDPDGKTA
jgi:hypothetical protein